jgi:opacity protein-like surface antigen
MRILAALSIASVASLPMLVQAEHLGRNSYKSGPSMYLFGGLSASKFDFEEGDLRYSFGDGSLSNARIDNESSALRFGFGFGISPELGLELGYVDLGTLTASAFSDGSQFVNNGYSTGRVDLDGDADGVFLGLNLHTPLHEQVGLFARFGVYSWEFEGTVEDSSRKGDFLVDGADPYIGVGARINLAENTSIQLAYDYYVMDDDKSLKTSVDTISVDIVLRF